jgi:hypothetical protein
VNIKALLLLLLLLRGKDEIADFEDLWSVLCDSSIQILRLPTSTLLLLNIVIYS